jgi:hypothetical protein
MREPKQTLLTLLKSIEGSGSFSTSGVKKFTPPGLHVKGIGEIGFPVNELQAKAIINLARQAPYGKGSQTLTDTAVRNSWEVDAALLSFQGKEWADFFDKILKKVKKELGISQQPVTASLYKLLLYEKGGFFKTHKDSEKAPGMFGTLVIGLPAAHTGGKLAVRFGGQEEVIAFSEAASGFKIPYAAFFADCDHELQPVNSGYRVCLVYNLLQAPGTEKIKSIDFSDKSAQMVLLLKKLEPSFKDKPLAVLLGHQYTPANFSKENLKLHDRPRAEALMQAAEAAGYFAGLALVTHYLMGDLEEPDYGYRGRNRYRSYDRYYEDDEPTGGSMGDVHEQYTHIEHWSGDGAPSLGSIHLDEDDLLTDLEIGDGNPTEQQAEGYTGNAGMTMEYWYHYGAVILWPKSKHAGLLNATPVYIRLGWLDHYAEHWDATAASYARQLVEGFEPKDFERNFGGGPSADPLVSALIQLGDEALLRNSALPILENAFEAISSEAWAALVEHFGPAFYDPMLLKKAASGKKNLFKHYLAVLEAMAQEGGTGTKHFVLAQMQHLPENARLAKLHKLKDADSDWNYWRTADTETPTAILEKILRLAPLKNEDAAWAQAMLDSLTVKMPRDYANDVLLAVLLGKSVPASPLADLLRQACAKDLQARTKTKPTPPPNWSRKLPNSKSNQSIWELLRTFLESPTERVFDYRQNEALRRQMTEAISREAVDLNTETIKKGSPYTLRLTKNQAAYELAVQHYEEDLKLLKKLG